jgi:hypothetical protein
MGRGLRRLRRRAALGPRLRVMSRHCSCCEGDNPTNFLALSWLVDLSLPVPLAMLAQQSRRGASRLRRHSHSEACCSR